MAWRVLFALAAGEAWTSKVGLEAVFAISFGVPGFALLLWARSGHARRRAVAALRTQHPGRPWLWRPEWATGRVPGGARATTLFAWLFAIVWNALTAPLVWKFPEYARDEPLMWIALAFPVVGVGLVVWAVRATLRWLRYGRSVFELATLPGVVGGQLRGTVHVRTLLRPERGFDARLTCVNRVSRGHGKNRSTWEHIRWQETARVEAGRAVAGPLGTAIPVTFTIPYEARPSSPEPSDDMIVWRLEVSAEVSGIDFHAHFEVPVFRTEESSPDIHERAISREAAGPAPVLSPTAAPVRRGSRIVAAVLPDGGLELRFPAARNPGMATALLGVTVFWNGMVYIAEREGGLLALPIVVIFGLFGLLFVYATIDAWLGTRRVRVRPGMLRVTHKILGLGGTSEHRADEVEGFSLEMSGRMGSTPYYDLAVKRRGKRKPTPLAGGIRDKREAEELLELVRRSFGAAGS